MVKKNLAIPKQKAQESKLSMASTPAVMPQKAQMPAATSSAPMVKTQEKQSPIAENKKR